MDWTIEKVRQLPEDNWYGVKPNGVGLWRCGGQGFIFLTGDSGVLDYVRTCDAILIKEKPITDIPFSEYTKLVSEISKILFKDRWNGSN